MKFFRLLLEDATRLQRLRAGKPVVLNPLQVAILSCSPRLLPCTLYRCSAALHTLRVPFIGRAIALLNFVVFGVEIAAQCEIGGGLLLPHPHGTVLGAAGIGKNVTILQGVTLGAKTVDLNFDPALRPTIEDDVVIGAGAKVLGPVCVGAGAIVGANAVVVHNVPPRTKVGGVPAREL